MWTKTSVIISQSLSQSMSCNQCCYNKCFQLVVFYFYFFFCCFEFNVGASGKSHPVMDQIMETDNNQRVDNLANKISMLKGVGDF